MDLDKLADRLAPIIALLSSAYLIVRIGLALLPT